MTPDLCFSVKLNAELFIQKIFQTAHPRSDFSRVPSLHLSNLELNTAMLYIYSGVSKNKKGGCSDFQETIQQQGPIGGMPPQNFEKKQTSNSAISWYLCCKTKI